MRETERETWQMNFTKHILSRRGQLHREGNSSVRKLSSELRQSSYMRGFMRGLSEKRGYWSGRGCLSAAERERNNNRWKGPVFTSLTTEEAIRGNEDTDLKLQRATTGNNPRPVCYEERDGLQEPSDELRRMEKTAQFRTQCAEVTLRC